MKTVLLIDDDRDDAELLQQALEQIDPTFSFYALEESRLAMNALLRERSISPDLIFLDINLPVLSGWECLDQIRQSDHLKTVPVYIFTTSSRPDEKEKALHKGAAGFITKPSDFKTLVNIIAEAINVL